MAILINGSICLTDLVDKFKAGHSAFNKSTKNGKIYVNYTEWVNEEPNEHGQHSSILLNSSKEKKDTEGKVYIGNGKKVESKGAEITAADTNISLDEPAQTEEKLPF